MNALIKRLDSKADKAALNTLAAPNDRRRKMWRRVLHRMECKLIQAWKDVDGEDGK